MRQNDEAAASAASLMCVLEAAWVVPAGPGEKFCKAEVPGLRQIVAHDLQRRSSFQIRQGDQWVSRQRGAQALGENPLHAAARTMRTNLPRRPPEKKHDEQHV